ncbi:LysR family transcriptional regulator [Kitasatospora sp. NBC_00315]|uniref:LysR family transcriptional regulator n=1 Tax=Kitasatospora sp. NBC_00315 TaxID=2975963 RepID=UPI0032430C40
MIDARRLRTLRAVADHRTVTAAAAALYLTPSAVSQQLAALEQETGHDLLARDGRGVRLTAAGEILLRHADVVLAQLERAEADLAAYSAGVAGEVTVASFATGIALVLAPAIRALAAQAPGVRLKVLDAEGDASLPMLLDGRADLAVAVEYRGAPQADDLRLTRVPLYAEPFEAVLPLEHPLAAGGRPSVLTAGPGRTADSGPVAGSGPAASLVAPGVIDLADLAAEPWIGPYPGNPCHDVVLLACEHAGFQPRLVHSSDDFHAVLALASAGAGVALVPRSALRGADLSRVAVRPVDSALATRKVFAAVRAGAEGHPLLRPVLAALAEAAARTADRAAAGAG